MIGHSQLQPQTNLMQRCQINQDFRVAKGWAGRKGGGVYTGRLTPTRHG